MITLQNVSKYYSTRFGRKYVLRDVTYEFPQNKNVAILGRNGAGKSTLLRLLGGIDFPEKGTITTDKHISWPLALSSGFQGSMTGAENTRFVCRIYGAYKTQEVEAFVQEFSELGQDFYLPVKDYSTGMRSRLAFALSMAFKFDVYLLDEITSVGDPKFREKAVETFNAKRESANVIMVSHAPAMIRKMCDMGVVLKDGVMEVYSDLEEAIWVYQHQ